MLDWWDGETGEVWRARKLGLEIVWRKGTYLGGSV